MANIIGALLVFGCLYTSTLLVGIWPHIRTGSGRIRILASLIWLASLLVWASFSMLWSRGS